MFRVLCPLCRSLLSSISRDSKILRAAHNAELESEEIPIIRYPAGRHKEYLRAKNRKKIKGKTISVPRPGKLLISTNDRKLNQYTNEFPTKFEPPNLASQTWTSTKSPGRYFTIHPSRENPSTDYTEKEKVEFENLNLTENILTSLQNLNMKVPTNIQRLVIPEILKGDNVMLAAETGSGKTYGYLLPIMQRILQMKQNEGSFDGPSAIILTPSKELSHQVLRMSNELNLPIKVGDLDALWLQKQQKLSNKMDVLVGTPVLSLTALRRRIISMNDIRFIVVDECDTLLDESFSKYVCNILGRINIRDGVSKPLLEEKFAQLILCSATFPNYAERALSNTIPISKLSAISTGYMHRISPHVKHKFIRLRPSEKLASLINLLQESKDGENALTMVFCNRKNTVHWLAKELIFHGINADKLYSGVGIKDRRHVVKEARTGTTGVLVCTDLSSRGLDTQRIQHVVNFDFPSAASDYIHRSGRVGRVGQDNKGKVTSFICRKWEVPLVMKIEEAARRRERVEGVNANIKSYHSRRWDKKVSNMEDGLDSYYEG